MTGHTGENLPEGADPAGLRASDNDRQRVAEQLREAAGQGRLDLDELDERLGAAYGAKTYADLAPLTADLPGEARERVDAWAPTVGHVPAARHDLSVAVMSGVSRKGLWEVGPRHRVIAICGGVELDLREARFAERETVIDVFAFWGGVTVTVNAATAVVVNGVGVMGAFEQERDKVEARLTPGSPVVHVRGAAIMGGVSVVRGPMPGEKRRRLEP